MFRSSTGLRAPFALLLGCALLLRVLIPAGWMPAAGGGLRIELCADGGAMAGFEREAQRRFDQAVAGAAGHAGKSERSDDPRKDQPCAFSGLALAWTQPEAFGLLSPAPPPAAAPVPALVAAVGRGLAAPPPPSTGPPAFS
jgi:hypothetical protein